MAKAMQNFRRFVGGSLDALLDQVGQSVKQAAAGTKAGSAYHADVELELDLVGEVEEQSDGGLDLKITGTAPIAGGAGVVSPEFGWGSHRQGDFGGRGNVRLRARVALVNAVALEAGVDANDPGAAGGGR